VAAPVAAPQRVAAPAPVAAEQVKPASGSYVVVSGDTLYGIAKANKLKVSDLKQWPNINDARHLQVDQQLRLSESDK
jgi:lipoprotein NlpD